MAVRAVAIEPNAYYTLDEAARALRTSKVQVQTLVQRGELHGIKLGREWRLLGASLLALGMPEGDERAALTNLSAATFNRIWDNPEDAIYDNWTPK
jgi:excisionase family DNA binding protein